MAFLSTNPIKSQLITAATTLVSPSSAEKRLRLLDWAVFLGDIGDEDAYFYFGPSYTEGYIVAGHHVKTLGNIGVWSPDLVTGMAGHMYPHSYRALLEGKSPLFLGEPGESLGLFLSGGIAPASGKAGFFRYREE